MKKKSYLFVNKTFFKNIFVCKQNFLIWTKRKLRILIHGLHYRSHHLGWLTLESLVAKKKVKKRLGAWERYLVCRQMRFVFLLGNSTFDPMQQSEAAALCAQFWSCMPSKQVTTWNPWTVVICCSDEKYHFNQ